MGGERESSEHRGQTFQNWRKKGRNLIIIFNRLQLFWESWPLLPPKFFKVSYELSGHLHYIIFSTCSNVYFLVNRILWHLLCSDSVTRKLLWVWHDHPLPNDIVQRSYSQIFMGALFWSWELSNVTKNNRASRGLIRPIFIIISASPEILAKETKTFAYLRSLISAYSQVHKEVITLTMAASASQLDVQTYWLTES